MNRAMRSKQRGFTLTEVMITVAIVAILGTLSVSSYRRYAVKAYRVDATSALLNIQVAQEKFFLQNNRYANTGQVALDPPAGLGLRTTTPGGRYTITITPAAPTTTYTAIAIPTSVGGQSNDSECSLFSVNESGTKGASNGGGSSSTNTCWR